MNHNLSELVDIVDENNIVIRQMSKSQAHQQGLLHRTVISEIINSKGQWLLVKQAGDKQDPGQYVSPVGGHIKAGEAELEALAREAHEETGITDIDNLTVLARPFLTDM
jgi:isopentenyl-diphosphate delta-isomerase